MLKNKMKELKNEWNARAVAEMEKPSVVCQVCFFPMRYGVAGDLRFGTCDDCWALIT